MADDAKDRLDASDPKAKKVDRRAAKRRRIKEFWSAESVPDAADLGPGAELRVGGLIGQPPQSQREWDLHVRWTRHDQGEAASVSEETAEAVAKILTRPGGRRRPAEREIKREAEPKSSGKTAEDKADDSNNAA